MLSRRGICSRSQATELVRSGLVRVDGRTVLNPEHPIDDGARITLEGRHATVAPPVWIALNKPRGLVTTTRDERGRETVYRCLDGGELPWLAPVGRLDKASEGLLLFCNDPAAAAALGDPASGVCKTYHVQVAPVPTAATLAALRAGTVGDDDEPLSAERVDMLRAGEKAAWLEIVLTGGRNRHIRRMVSAVGLETRRLVRVAIGPLALGDLGKGSWRRLEGSEVAALLGGIARLSRSASPAAVPRA